VAWPVPELDVGVVAELDAGVVAELLLEALEFVGLEFVELGLVGLGLVELAPEGLELAEDSEAVVCVEPGSANATAPAVSTLATPTPVVA
jgi:hypothetical protein